MDPVDQVSVSNYATFTNNPITNTDVNGDLVFGIFGSTRAQRKRLKVLQRHIMRMSRIKWSKDISVIRCVYAGEIEGYSNYVNRETYFSKKGVPQDISMSEYEESNGLGFEIRSNIWLAAKICSCCL